MPAVSVVIPVYKVEPYMARCVRSLFGQTLTDIEFIFVDDCTPDRSMEVMLEVLEEFPNRKEQVKCYHMPQNGGLAKARHQGIALAEGDYIINCDSDDELISQDAYRLMYEKAVAEDLDIVTCNFLKENASGRTHEVYEACGNVSDLLLDRVQGYLFVRMFRRSLLQSGYHVPKGDMGEDLVLSLQLTLRAKRCGHINEPFYLYKYRSSSISKLQGKEAAIARHRSLVANVGMLVELLVSSLAFSENDSVIRSFKYYSRHCIEPYVGDRECFLLWRSAFPEIDGKLLFTDGVSLAKKVWFILIYLRLYKPVKRITSLFRPHINYV